MRKGWKTYLLYGGIVTALAVFIYIIFETIRLRNTGFETKTLWDWMELLIIPAVLASGAIWLERSERKVERQRTEERMREERQRAEEQAKFEQEIETDRQRETALQTYIDRMSDLILEGNLRDLDLEARNIARTRTLTILKMLDPKRKGQVIRFLIEAKLICIDKSVNSPFPMEATPVTLIDADLREVDLSGFRLAEANFYKADLRGANLSGANLDSAILNLAKLSGADLQHANLHGAGFYEADLRNANLERASLEEASLEVANLDGSNLRHTYMGSANLSYTDLEKADLFDANLEMANLTNAKITSKQLAELSSLYATTMPDGTKHDES